MRTIVIGNLKGGIGKSTSTENLAYAISSLRKKVLVVDADPQTNSTPFLTKANANGKTILDVVRHPEKVKRCIYQSRYEGISVIKGNTALKEGDVTVENWFMTAMDAVCGEYDFCLVDTRPVFENITTSVTYAADLFLTPVYLDNYCRDNLALVEEFLDSLPEEKRPEWKVFATMVDSRRKSQRDIYEDLLTKHNYPFMGTCISDSAVVDNALRLYKPVMKHRSKSQVALDYMDLAKEIVEMEV